MEKNSNVLMLIATLCTFLLLALLLFFPLPDKNAQTFLALASFVCGFYFGSSVKQPAPPQPADLSTVINQAIIDAAKK